MLHFYKALKLYRGKSPLDGLTVSGRSRLLSIKVAFDLPAENWTIYG